MYRRWESNPQCELIVLVSKTSVSQPIPPLRHFYSTLVPIRTVTQLWFVAKSTSIYATRALGWKMRVELTHTWFTVMRSTIKLQSPFDATLRFELRSYRFKVWGNDRYTTLQYLVEVKGLEPLKPVGEWEIYSLLQLPLCDTSWSALSLGHPPLLGAILIVLSTYWGRGQVNASRRVEGTRTLIMSTSQMWRSTN